jgi:hypothetical protein
MSWEEGNQKRSKKRIRSNQELAKLEGFLEEKEAKTALCEFLKNNITFSTNLLLGVELYPYQHIAIKTMCETDYTLGIWCKHPEEYILTESGYKKIKDVKVGERVQSRYGLNKITDKWLNPQEDGLEIEFTNGISFKAKLGHKILVLDKGSSDYSYKRIQDITSKDLVPIKCQSGPWGNLDLIKEFYLEGIKDSSETFYDLGKTISGEEVCHESLEYAFLFENWIKMLKVKRGECIPDLILQCQKKSIISLLQGIFDYSGFCYEAYDTKCLGIKSKSYDFLKQVYMLLLNLGIYSCIEEDEEYHQLLIRSEDSFVKFSEKINFKEESKRLTLINILFSKFEEEDYFIVKDERENFVLTSVRELRPIFNESIDITVENEECYLGYGFVHHNSRGGSKSFSTAIFAGLDAMLNPGVQTGILSKSFRQCLTGDTALKTKTGFKILKEIKKGEFVRSDYGWNQVLNKWKNKKSKGIKISATIKEGQDQEIYSITGKEHHKIRLLDDSYREIKDIALGDKIKIRAAYPYFTNELHEGVITYWEEIKEIETYDIEVEDEHCYWGNGFINHNSKMIFKKLEEISQNPDAILFKQCIKKISKSNDEWVMEIGDSVIRSLPLADGSKLRGFRFHRIIVDELLLMPEKVLNEVILPFLSVVENPIEREKVGNLEDELIASGLMTEQERYIWPNNKLIGLSSASYKFEYLYRLYQQYENLIFNPTKNVDTNATRAIIQMSLDALPPKLYDQNLVEQSKATMSRSQFDREFGAIFTDDSSGYFLVSKMAECTIPDGSSPTIEIQGEPKEEYLLSFDPSWAQNESSDDFAIQILKLNLETKKSTLVHSYALPGASTKNHIKYFTYCLENFNIVAICGDYNGGVQFIQACNESSIFKQKGIKLRTIDVPFDNPEDYKADLRSFKSQYDKEAKQIVYLRTPTSKWIRQANELLQANFDHKRIFFASRATDDSYFKQRAKNIPIGEIKYSNALALEGESDGAKMIDFIEHQSEMIILTKEECALIQASSNPQGSQTFDLPPSLKRQTGQNKTRKDSYSALLLGNWMSRIYYDFKDGGNDDFYETFEPMFIA